MVVFLVLLIVELLGRPGKSSEHIASARRSIAAVRYQSVLWKLATYMKLDLWLQERYREAHQPV
jgi:hypothetical protein